MNLLKRLAQRLLRNDVVQAAKIIAGVTTQATHIERDCLQAVETRQPSVLKPSNEYEADTFATMALLAVEPAKLRLRLEIRCDDTQALSLVAASLPETRFRASDIQLEGSSLCCFITLGLSREQVKAYLQMLPG